MSLYWIRDGNVPHATEEQLHDLLWVCSPYPCLRDVRKIRRSIRKYLRAANGSIAGAVACSEAELDRAMKEYQMTQETQKGITVMAGDS